MILDFKKYVSNLGLVKSNQIKNQEELLSIIVKPSWIDAHKKRKKYCYQTNLGTIEISMMNYEQLDIDIEDNNLNNIVINFEYEEEMLNKKYYQEKYFNLIENIIVNDIDFSETLLLKNGAGLVFYNNKLSSIYFNLTN